MAIGAVSSSAAGEGIHSPRWRYLLQYLHTYLSTLPLLLVPSPPQCGTRQHLSGKAAGYRYMQKSRVEGGGAEEQRRVE